MNGSLARPGATAVGDRLSSARSGREIKVLKAAVRFFVSPRPVPRPSIDAVRHCPVPLCRSRDKPVTMGHCELKTKRWRHVDPDKRVLVALPHAYAIACSIVHSPPCRHARSKAAPSFAALRAVSTCRS